MWLTKPNTGIRVADTFAQFGYGFPDSHPFSSTPSLEEATGMSIKTFYETFLDPDTQSCLKVPRGLGDMAP
jgi:hypothetical protein